LPINISESIFRARGAREIFNPRRKDYDLTHEAHVAQIYCDANPDLVIKADYLVKMTLGSPGKQDHRWAQAERASQIRAIKSCYGSLPGYRTPCQLVSSL